MNLWRQVLAVCMVMLTMFLAAASVTAHGDGERKPLNSKAETMDACVRETPDMRRNHMDYLKHKRDLTMRQGVRTADLSLNECVDCHAGKNAAAEYVPVTAEGQFCAGCHESVGERMDCFMCHRTTPEMPANHTAAQ